MPVLSSFAAALADTAHRAGAVLLKHYAGDVQARAKSDSSPVTIADEEAEALILEALAELAPEIPVIAEEAWTAGRLREAGPRFFLVDPLDGTKEFLKKNGEFTVNIALIEHGRPVCGVVLVPAKSQLFVGDGANGAFELAAPPGLALAQAVPIQARPAPVGGLIAVISRSHGDRETEEYLARYRIAERLTAGSSLKFCLVAAGLADLYPRHGPTMEWDTAAGQAVLEAAGGSVTQLDGAPFLYGKSTSRFRNPAFVARGLS